MHTKDLDLDFDLDLDLDYHYARSRYHWDLLRLGGQGGVWDPPAKKLIGL